MSATALRRAGPALALLVAGLVGGCADTRPDMFRAPQMSPVGSGLVANADPVVFHMGARRHASGNSLFQDGAANLFTDPRASKVGDTLTVKIYINDMASLGDTSGRSQTAQETGGFDWTFGLDSSTHKVNGAGDINASSSSNGQGSIDRSEKIQLSIAAVVTRVLPNGNLIISGSQEVRVNYEMRQLRIEGIVRPRDISKNNTIPYDKIAEARISYGGKGRIMEVQQPAWGQQIFDAVKPF